MKPRPDSPHRRNATGGEVPGEDLRGLHLEWIDVRHPGRECRVWLCLGIADDQHEQLAGPDKLYCRPCGNF